MLSEHIDAFHKVLNFSTSDAGGNEPYVKFHLNTGQSREWICYYGVYGVGGANNWFPLWTKSGKGKTIYEAAYNALHAQMRLLAS